MKLVTWHRNGAQKPLPLTRQSICMVHVRVGDLW